MPSSRLVPTIQAGDSRRSRSSIITLELAIPSSPPTSTGTTKYSRSGSPLSWNVMEVVSPRSPKSTLRSGREYTR